MIYIVILGRPNVGKSTLFNKVVGGRPAIVDDFPGVTRDINMAIATHDQRRFAIIDSGGFEPNPKDTILSQVTEQAQMAIEEADLVFFMVDGRAGTMPVDEQIARNLRKAGKRTFLVINKIDTPAVDNATADFARLGLGEGYAVSAEHSLGIGGLLDDALCVFPEKETAKQDDEGANMKIAIVGKPNAGKSSMVNRLLGKQRMLVSEVAGTTRDAIDSEIVVYGKKYTLIDTAGIRRKSKVTQKLEKFSVIMAMKAIERAEVALLLVDALEGVSAQEARIGGLIESAGKACVIVVNKWDLVEKDEATTRQFEETARRKLKFLSHAPFVFVSSLTGQRLPKIWNAVEEVYAQYSKRINSSALNSLVERVTGKKPLPIFKNKRVKIYYATQPTVNPPTFVFMTNYPAGVHFSYRRYLVNQLRSEAGFDKTPIRMVFRKPAGRRTGQRR